MIQEDIQAREAITAVEFEQRPDYRKIVRAEAKRIRAHQSSHAQRIKDRAERRSSRLINNEYTAAKLFIAQAIDFYLFKRDENWRCVDGDNGEAYSSFDAYVSTPHERIEILPDGTEETIVVNFTSSTVHLGVQLTFGLMYLFWIHERDLISVGQKKLSLLIPYFEKQIIPRGQVWDAVGQCWRLLREADPLAWHVLRQIVQLWITKAKTATYDDLGVLLGKQKGWETGISDSVPVGALRSFTKVEDLLQYLGIKPNLPDGKTVKIKVTWKK